MAAKKKVGQPGKFDDATRAKVIEALRGGNYREVAASYAGITRQTLVRWMAQGKREQSGAYHEFRVAALKAECDAEFDMVKAIVDAAATDPKHAQWWLERKFPERWASNNNIIREMLKRINTLEEAAGAKRNPPGQPPPKAGGRAK